MSEEKAESDRSKELFCNKNEIYINALNIGNCQIGKIHVFFQNN